MSGTDANKSLSSLSNAPDRVNNIIEVHLLVALRNKKQLSMIFGINKKNFKIIRHIKNKVRHSYVVLS